MDRSLFGIPCADYIYDQACNNFVQYPVPYILFIIFIIIPILFGLAMLFIMFGFKQP